MKIGIVSSVGGHLTEARMFKTAYDAYEHFYVLNDGVILPEDMRGRTYTVKHSERDWRLVVNLWEAWRILRREQPTLLLSTGAGPIVPFALVARVLSVRILYIETVTRISRPSLTGRLMYLLADRFVYQWPELGRFFPCGIYGGSLL